MRLRRVLRTYVHEITWKTNNKLVSPISFFCLDDTIFARANSFVTSFACGMGVKEFFHFVSLRVDLYSLPFYAENKVHGMEQKKVNLMPANERCGGRMGK